MINFNNNNITGMSYNGHTIKKAYGCDGNLVWEKEFTGKFRAKYSDGRTHEVECNYSTTLSSGETTPSGYQPSAMTEAIIGNCVKYIGDSAFNHCHSLTSIIIPDSVTGIWENAFYYCYGLTGNLNIPDSVTNINHAAFQACSGLTSITIGTGITNIGETAFADCKNLTSITILATTPPALETTPFYNTNNCPIYVPCESIDAYKTAPVWSSYSSRIQCPPFTGKWKATYANGSTLSAECDSSSAITSNEINKTNLVSVEIGDCVEKINERAIAECSSITGITIGTGIKTIETYAFSQCSNLTSLTLYATVPPTTTSYMLFSSVNCQIYVPASSVDAYKSASGWSSLSSRIQPIP